MWGNQNNQLQQQQLENARLQKELLKIQKAQAGKPKAMKFDNQLQSDGTIKESLQSGSNLDTRYLDAMREEGLREAGDASAWRNLIDDKITREAGQQGAGIQAAQARQLDNLAMRGGVSAGAAERMAQAGVGQQLQAQQNVFGKRLQADLADEQNRLNALQGLGQAEMGAAQYQTGLDQFNLNAAAQERFQKRAFDTNQYNEQMRAWAAERTAKATPSGGGGKK